MTAIENETYRIDPLGADDLHKYEDLTTEIFQLLSDKDTLQFLPHKRLHSVFEARDWLNTALLNYYSGRNQVHFIRSKVSGKLLGVVDLIPPFVAREHYRLPQYPFFIEFYLRGTARGKMLMTRLLPEVVDQLRENGITQLAAVVNRRNVPATKVLQRSGFRRAGHFDIEQDLYCC